MGNWIMKYIMTTSLYVLVNGMLGEPFKPEKGLRHGDPLSHYIIATSAEYLERYIHFLTNVLKSSIFIKLLKMAQQFYI